jgi:hypothetical protein
VRVGKVRDAQTFELGRQARQLDVQRLEPKPARLEPCPGKRRAGGARKSGKCFQA